MNCNCTNILASTSITSEANDIDIVVPAELFIMVNVRSY